MSVNSGHFEDGRWVAGPARETEGASGAPDGMEVRVNEVKARVASAVGGVFSLARDLFGTEQGHRHLEKRINDAGTALEGAIMDIAREAESIIQGKTHSDGKKERK